MRVGEGDLLLPFDIVGGRAAFQVDGAVRQQRDAGRRRHRIELDLELVELELFLHGLDDLVADVHREADRLLVFVQIGKRDRGVAETERDRPGLLDVLQCPCQLLSPRPARAKRGGERKAQYSQLFHVSAPDFSMIFPECLHKPGRNRMYQIEAYGPPTASPVARRQTLFWPASPGLLRQNRCGIRHSRRLLQIPFLPVVTSRTDWERAPTSSSSWAYGRRSGANRLGTPSQRWPRNTRKPRRGTTPPRCRWRHEDQPRDAFWISPHRLERAAQLAEIPEQARHDTERFLGDAEQNMFIRRML